MNNVEIELLSSWFDSIEEFSTREDLSDEEKLFKIKLYCLRSKGFLKKIKQNNSGDNE